jgi:hypothetical protein
LNRLHAALNLKVHKFWHQEKLGAAVTARSELQEMESFDERIEDLEELRRKHE